MSREDNLKYLDEFCNNNVDCEYCINNIPTLFATCEAYFRKDCTDEKLEELVQAVKETGYDN